VTQRTT